ncbi:MAG TPA: DUF4190 domain-containing protein [Candidatus Saccharimonadales bacterium]
MQQNPTGSHHTPVPQAPAPEPIVGTPVAAPQPKAKSSDTLTVLTLIFGISAISSFITLGGVFFGIPGLIMGIISLKKTTNRGVHTAGLVLNAISLVGTIAILYFVMNSPPQPQNDVPYNRYEQGPSQQAPQSET